MLFVWLDDQRDPAQYGCEGWMWVRTATAAIELLESGQVVAISLDHDIGPEETGYDVVEWMEEQDVWPQRGVFVHSSNVSARVKMLLAIDRRYPELATRRWPMMTPLEQGVQADMIARGLL